MVGTIKGTKDKALRKVGLIEIALSSLRFGGNKELWLWVAGTNKDKVHWALKHSRAKEEGAALSKLLIKTNWLHKLNNLAPLLHSKSTLLIHAVERRFNPPLCIGLKRTACVFIINIIPIEKTNCELLKINFTLRSDDKYFLHYVNVGSWAKVCPCENDHTF